MLWAGFQDSRVTGHFFFPSLELDGDITWGKGGMKRCPFLEG